LAWQEGQNPVAVRAADPGEARARVAAIEIALYGLLDDRPEMTVLLLKTAIVDRQEPVEVMEQDPIEDLTLRMARTIDSQSANPGLACGLDNGGEINIRI
jgi:hypothetical protein